MTFSLLLAGIVFSVIAAIATLIMCIISLATGKQQNGLIYGVSFVMAIILAILSIVKVVEKGANKMKQGVEWLKDLDEKNKSHWNTNDDKENYYAYIPSENKDTIANSFYNSSENDRHYIPLVFPYRFASDDMFMNFASLEIMKGDSSFRPADGDSCFNQFQCISDFTFDDKLLLAKRDNKELRQRIESWKKKDIPDYSFILFDFSTGKCKEFWNEDRLNEEAKARGFHSKTAMQMTTTHYFNYSSYEGD